MNSINQAIKRNVIRKYDGSLIILLELFDLNEDQLKLFRKILSYYCTNYGLIGRSDLDWRLTNKSILICQTSLEIECNVRDIYKNIKDGKTDHYKFIEYDLDILFSYRYNCFEFRRNEIKEVKVTKISFANNFRKQNRFYDTTAMVNALNKELEKIKDDRILFVYSDHISDYYSTQNVDYSDKCIICKKYLPICTCDSPTYFKVSKIKIYKIVHWIEKNRAVPSIELLKNKLEKIADEIQNNNLFIDHSLELKLLNAKCEQLRISFESTKKNVESIISKYNQLISQ
jgi:hypothetical protein